MKWPFEDQLLELERNQLQCIKDLISTVEKNHQQHQNLLVGVTLINWVLMLIIFITVFLN